MLFVCLLPIFTLIIFNLTIGKSPDPLKLGIINNESPSRCSYQSIDICDSHIPISCKFIKEVEKQGLTLVIDKYFLSTLKNKKY